MAKKTRTIKTKAGYGKKPGKIILPAKEKPARFNSPIDEGDKARFLFYVPIVSECREAVASATAKLRNSYKAAKADGFTKADFDYAHDVETPERESAAKEGIRRRLLVAKWMGSDLGSQLDLFSEPARVPDQDAILRAKVKKVADKYTTNHPTKLQGGLGMPKVPKTQNSGGFMDSREALRVSGGLPGVEVKRPNMAKPNGGGFGMDEEEFAAEQARAAPALSTHGLDEDEAP